MTVERLVPGTGDWLKYSFEHIQRYDYFSHYYTGKKVLDIACGVGYGTKIIAKEASSVTGIDISGEAINYAQDHFSSDNIIYVKLDYRDIETLGKKFDLVVCFETIEHIEEPGDFFRLMRNVLSDQGQIICSTPNKIRFTGAGINNPFHFSELYIEEFIEIFGRYFTINERFHQTESMQYLRFQDLQSRLLLLENKFKSSLWIKIEAVIRKMLNRQFPLPIEASNYLLNMTDGDMEITPLIHPEPQHKTYILVGSIK